MHSWCPSGPVFLLRPFGPIGTGSPPGPVRGEVFGARPSPRGFCWLLLSPSPALPCAPCSPSVRLRLQVALLFPTPGTSQRCASHFCGSGFLRKCLVLAVQPAIVTHFGCSFLFSEVTNAPDVSLAKRTPIARSSRVTVACCASAVGLDVPIPVAVGCTRPARLSVSD